MICSMIWSSWFNNVHQLIRPFWSLTEGNKWSFEVTNKFQLQPNALKNDSNLMLAKGNTNSPPSDVCLYDELLHGQHTSVLKKQKDIFLSFVETRTCINLAIVFPPLKNWWNGPTCNLFRPRIAVRWAHGRKIKESLLRSWWPPIN